MSGTKGNSVGGTLRLLIVEDSEDDTRLLIRFLARDGYEVAYQRVDTAAGMREALHHQAWDLIIADYRLPNFSGLDALKIAQASGLDLPFIVMSGVIGEETAVAAMRAGAHDYLMKDNMARLGPAIERELREAAERRARKQAERQVYQLSRALEQSASLVLVTGVDGKIEYLNPSFSRVTGYEREALLGENLAQWPSAGGEMGDGITLSSLIKAGLSWRGEIELHKKNGESYWALAAVSPIRDEGGSTCGFLIVQEDITERKRLEDELRHYMTRLEQMVEERTTELAATNQQLRQEIMERKHVQDELIYTRDQALSALRFKTQLIANLNHEIRTPLSVIHLKINLLSRGYYGAANENQKQAFLAIQSEAQTLLHLVENLIEVAKLEADPGVIELCWLTPDDLITQVFPKLLPVAQAKGLTLRYDIAKGLAHNIRGDLDQLKRILLNLVDNAIKFTDTGEICVRFYQPDSQHWVMQVTDTGVGIPESAQSHIFEPFWRADHPAEQNISRGVGLGLSVVQKLVGLMGGEIRVASDGQCGTTFTVTLPIEYSG